MTIINGVAAVIVVTFVLALFALAHHDERRPYKPYDLSKDDFDLRTLAAGFLAAGGALAFVAVGLAVLR